MHTALMIAQTIVSLLLMLVILIQNRSSGLSSTFGGSGSVSTTKRGAERVVFNATIVLAVLFVLLALTSVFVR